MKFLKRRQLLNRILLVLAILAILAGLYFGEWRTVLVHARLL